MSAFFEKKSVKICAAILIFIALTLLFLESGRAVVSKSTRTWVPDYEREDISYLLDGRELTDADYELIYRQSGLTRLGVDELIEGGRIEQILKIQDDFFASDELEVANFGLFISSFDRAKGYYAYPELKNGDIICSFSTYLSYFEIGHCAIVIDAERGLLAEITGYGSTVDLVYASKVFTNSTHVVLRPKCDESVRLAAAEYVSENMIGMDYDIFVGILNKKAPSDPRRTHCAHFVWYAYNTLGIDLDSNGGGVVTPRDICMSEHLDIIAVRGVNPETLAK
ncbi:MAG: hypothetical protein IJW03_03390 [Clostridia bacterium]|nr:hypothetical protein [Clostridia bacterium]